MRPSRSVGDQQKNAALSLLKRLPPQDLEENLVGFAKFAPHLEQGIAAHVSKPLRVGADPTQKKYFITCDFNCDGSTFRSPWSNKYYPPPKGGDSVEEKLFRPSERLRRLEEQFNEVLEAYKNAYYEGGVSSVYLWDLDEGFAAAFLIRKELVKDKDVEKGIWESVHVLEVREPTNSNSWVDYKLTTTIRLHVECGECQIPGTGETELAGLITRQAMDKQKKVGQDSHILHMGRMIEEMEISIRQSLEVVYLPKQREVLNYCRLFNPADQPCSRAPDKIWAPMVKQALTTEGDKPSVAEQQGGSAAAAKQDA